MDQSRQQDTGGPGPGELAGAAATLLKLHSWCEVPSSGPACSSPACRPLCWYPGARDMQRGRNVEGAAKVGKGETQHRGSSPDSGVDLLPEKLPSAPAGGGYCRAP